MISLVNILTPEIEKLPAVIKSQTTHALAQFSEKLQQQEIVLPEDKRLFSSIVKVWACSQFISESSIREPKLLLELISSEDLFSHQTKHKYRFFLTTQQVTSEADLMSLLRRFRRREMIRIAWRDLAGWTELTETLADLSALAEACIEFALEYLYLHACEKQGTPLLADRSAQQLVVLGMGKLGAWELNYSSDIDLIFAYAEDGVLNDRKQTTYGEFFTRLSRRLVKVLDEITVDGFVFRTDTRLRPFGDSGPIVMSFDGMENYYQDQAREWERYAMIKARQVAGDKKTGPMLLAMLQPFIYRRYLDYGAFDELRALKFQISQELKRKDKMQNIKLGPGGIREIEFIGQAFQLIRGGSEKRLQQREILVVLDVLGELECLSQADVRQLKESYIFLRHVENHIQQYQDKQTHDLPREETVQSILAFSLGFPDWRAFKTQLDEVRDSVQSVFELVFSLTEEQETDKECAAIWVGEADEIELQDHLKSLGYLDAKQILALIAGFKKSNSIKRLTTKGINVLNRLMPQLFEAVPQMHNPDETLKRILHLFEVVSGRNVYLSLLSENQNALTQLIKLTSASPWIGDYLSRYPVLFDELLDTRSLYDPLDHDGLVFQLQQHIKNKDCQEVEQLMIILRQFKQINVLRVAAADIMEMIPVMVVSDYLTWIAETVLQQVVKSCWCILAEKHGVPPDSETEITGFAVLGLGKLGGMELGYGSDLDMVFVYDCADGNALTRGNKPISSRQFYGRLGQKIMHMLNTKMLSGILYEVDMRLRPSGNSGLLVNQIKAYENYLLKDAWTWEHQALIRGRFITGDLLLQKAFIAIQKRVLRLPRERLKLKQEIRDMRQKMRENLVAKETSKFDLKQGKGGIADIEFIVQFMVLAHAAENEQLVAYTDNVRLIHELQQLDYFSVEQANSLTTAYYHYRDLAHRETLQGNRAMVDEQEVVTLRAQVVEIWREIIECAN